MSTAHESLTETRDVTLQAADFRRIVETLQQYPQLQSSVCLGMSNNL